MMVEFVNHKKAASIWDGVCKEFCGPCLSSWRASEASETLSGVYKFELMRYVYIYIYTPSTRQQLVYKNDIPLLRRRDIPLFRGRN